MATRVSGSPRSSLVRSGCSLPLSAICLTLASKRSRLRSVLSALSTATALSDLLLPIPTSSRMAPYTAPIRSHVGSCPDSSCSSDTASSRSWTCSFDKNLMMDAEDLEGLEAESSAAALEHLGDSAEDAAAADETCTRARSADSSSSSSPAWPAKPKPPSPTREAQARSRSFSSLRARHSWMTLRSATLGDTSVSRSSRCVSGHVGRRPLSRHSRNHLRIASRSNVCPVSIVTGSRITCFVSGHTNASNAPSSSDISTASPAINPLLPYRSGQAAEERRGGVA
uniref:Uncharacterized protein n=1 Tax=Oryza meridionalis TaxID=40149 RepID=A0A0E0D457_9ORYZ